MYALFMRATLSEKCAEINNDLVYLLLREFIIAVDFMRALECPWKDLFGENHW